MIYIHTTKTNNILYYTTYTGVYEECPVFGDWLGLEDVLQKDVHNETDGVVVHCHIYI
jgi:hypothetical protein